MQTRILTVATYLTLLRLSSIPFIVLLMTRSQWGNALAVFLVIALTDLADGFIARQFNQQTWFGSLLDPLADKLLILSCFGTLVFYQSSLFSIPNWFFLLLVCKELLLLMGALFLYLLSGTFLIKPHLFGKLAMALQTIFIGWLFACYFFHWVPLKTYFVMLGLVLGVTTAAFLQYALMGFELIKRIR